MAKGSAGLVLTAGAGVAAVVAGVWAIWGPGEEPTPTQEPAALLASPDEPPAPAAPEVSLTAEAPRFDVVRVDAGGLATIAGNAPPGGAVSLRLDGAEAARLVADGTGQFATVLTFPPSDAPRILSLALMLPDGSEVAGQETVALAPIAAPEVEVAAAPEAPAALLVSPEGVTVLQSGAATDTPALPISIDSIAYGVAGEVLLGGRATPSAALRIYLDEAPVVDAKADAQGKWQARLDEVAAGLHILRADEVGADGKVAARFETPFQRDLPEQIAVAEAPTVEAPAVEATVTEVSTVDPAAAASTTTESPEAPSTQTEVVENSATEPAAAEAPAAETPVASVVTADPPAPASADLAPAVAPAPVTITVQPGFTLWAIAEENFGEGIMYVQVFEANSDKIKDPDLIYPGQVLTVPKP